MYIPLFREHNLFLDRTDKSLPGRRSNSDILTCEGVDAPGRAYTACQGNNDNDRVGSWVLEPVLFEVRYTGAGKTVLCSFG